jgi:hypothetical protein
MAGASQISSALFNLAKVGSLVTTAHTLHKLNCTAVHSALYFFKFFVTPCGFLLRFWQSRCLATSNVVVHFLVMLVHLEVGPIPSPVECGAVVS